MVCCELWCGSYGVGVAGCVGRGRVGGVELADLADGLEGLDGSEGLELLVMG